LSLYSTAITESAGEDVRFDVTNGDGAFAVEVQRLASIDFIGAFDPQPTQRWDNEYGSMIICQQMDKDGGPFIAVKSFMV